MRSESLLEPQKLNRFRSNKEIPVPVFETPDLSEVADKLSRAKVKVEHNFELY